MTIYLPLVIDSQITWYYIYIFTEQAHSSVERAGLLGGVTLRQLKPDNKRRLRGDTLKEAIEEDKRNGLIPFYVSFTVPYG